MKIETIRLRNFKSFENVELLDIPSFCIVVGANGTGKTTLFDVFGFLKDCLTYNVSRALQSRGGFKEVVSRGKANQSIYIELQFLLHIAGLELLSTYSIKIYQKDGKVTIKDEVLSCKEHSEKTVDILKFQHGVGHAAIFTGLKKKDYSPRWEKEQFELDGEDTLALRALGHLSIFKEVNKVSEMIGNLHISNFNIDLARSSKDAAGYSEHLSVSGDNLQLVANHIYENHPQIFQQIIEKMKNRIPGIGAINSVLTDDGRLLLKFQDGSFKDPFIDKYVSDGTLKMFAYLVLLHDPRPHPLLCVEEPENQLYVSLLRELAEEFRSYARRGGQVFVSTHSPDFINAAELDEVFWLVKENGYSKIRRAKDDPQIAAYMNDGDLMGYLWKQGFFEGADPR